MQEVEISDRRMILKSMTLRNFKGIESFNLDTGGKDVFVFGDNGTGKTTLSDAVSWLLFDKDSSGQAKFEIKPIDTDGNQKHNLESEVEGVFNIGHIVTLKKTYKEKWTKKRGSLTKEMTGHATDHYIDDVPVKMKDYKAKVAEIATKEDVFRLLTSPTFFSEKLHWQDRRKMLFDVCGDVTDEDVILSLPELTVLPKILGGNSYEDHQKIIKSSRKKINKDIEEIPGRIDEVDRGRPELVETKANPAIVRLTALRVALDKINQEIASGKTDGRLAELRVDLATLDGDILTAKNAHTESTGKSTKKMREHLSRLETEMAQVGREIESKQASIDGNKSLLGSLENANKELRDDWSKIKQSVYTGDICPTCLQEIPEDQAEESRARFNESISSQLEENNNNGKANADKIKSLQDGIIRLTMEVKGLNDTVVGQKKQILSTEKKISDGSPEFETLPEWVELSASKGKIEDEIVSLENNEKIGEHALKLQSEKEEVEAEIKEQENVILLIEQDNKAAARIEELKAKEKKLAAEFEKLEGQLFLIETFIRQKVSMLEEKINDQFSLVKFKLFAEQVNGGLTETCEVTVGGVPYGSLNSGARVQSGIDIINTLARHHGFHPMIFVDNRESVTVLPDVECQLINMVVSETDKKLRVEKQ